MLRAFCDVCEKAVEAPCDLEGVWIHGAIKAKVGMVPFHVEACRPCRRKITLFIQSQIKAPKPKRKR